MNLSDEQLAQIKSCGIIKLQPGKLCILLGFSGIKKEEFMLEFNDGESEARQVYETGVAVGDYNIDVKLEKVAETGDILAIDELSKRQFRSKMNQLKKDLFGI